MALIRLMVLKAGGIDDAGGSDNADGADGVGLKTSG